MTSESHLPQRAEQSGTPPREGPGAPPLSDTELASLTDDELLEYFSDEENSSTTDLIVQSYAMFLTTPDDPSTLVMQFDMDIDAVAYFQPDDEFLRDCARLYVKRNPKSR